MDKRTLINNLHNLFYDERKKGGKYIKVWLSQPRILGFLKLKNYIMYVQTEQEIESYSIETTAVLNLLKEKANTELESIDEVDVHHCDDGFYCQPDDVLIFEERFNCKH